MKGITSRRLISVFAVVTTTSLSLWLVSVPTDTMLGYIGTDNAYLFMFLIAFVGSITTFASIPYPLILIGLVAAGMNPFLMGLASAFGVITADSFTFFIAGRGQILLSNKLKSAFQTLADYTSKYPHLLTPALIIYGTFSPLSNDFAVISFSLMKYKYHKIIPALAFGNIIYNIGLAFLGVYAYNWIASLI